MSDLPVWVFAAVPILLGLLLLRLTFKHLRHRKIKRAGGECICGLLILTLGLGTAAALANLYTYQRFNHEKPVANIHLVKIDDQKHLAEVTYPDESKQEFVIYGDEWQMDARVLKWQGLAVLLGADAHYRLERFSSRYRDIKDELNKPRSVYSLTTEPPVFNLDVWKWANKYRSIFSNKNWSAVDAIYGNGVYMPIAHNAVYTVHLAQSGLVARPQNNAASTAVDNWH